MNGTEIFERSGVSPRFPKIPLFLKKWKKVHQDSTEESNLLTEYATGRPVYRKSTVFPEPQRVGISGVRSSLGLISLDLSYQAQSIALTDSDEWLPIWRRAMTCAYWSHRLEWRIHMRAQEEFNAGKRRQRLRTLSLRTSGFLLGACVALGWTDEAAERALKVASGLDQDLYFDGTDWGHRRTQYFVLRLLLDWQKVARDWPPYALDVPAYNILVEQWSAEDPALLVNPLLAACDRHTYESRSDTSKKNFDLSDYDSMYMPFEILTVLRLRTLHGLALPSLDHPLMKTPLAKLPDTGTMQSDELLEGVLRQARREFGEI